MGDGASGFGGGEGGGNGDSCGGVMSSGIGVSCCDDGRGRGGGEGSCETRTRLVEGKQGNDGGNDGGGRDENAENMATRWLRALQEPRVAGTECHPRPGRPK